MKTHNEFMEDVKHFSSLPAKTCRALGPESDEDIAMYANELEHKKAVEYTDKIMEENNIKKLTKEQIAEIDANCEGGVQWKKMYFQKKMRKQ